MNEIEERFEVEVIEAADLLNIFQATGIHFYSGVPDSLLKSLSVLLAEMPAQQHVTAINEGAALAEASGYSLATGLPALVYLQNSGLGNLVNPLLSLAHSDLSAFPLLLLIGWRGYPEYPDEPQHGPQGRVLTDLLGALELPFRVLPTTLEEADPLIHDLMQMAINQSRPVALLVPPHRLKDLTKTMCLPGLDLHQLSRMEVLEHFVGCQPNALVFATTGYTSRALYALRQKQGQGEEQDFVNVGAMGHTLSLALAVARQLPEREILCFDGDGALLMHMGALAAAGHAQLPNWTHILFNNRVHDSVGGQLVAAPNTDFTALARGCGYTQTQQIKTDQQLKAITASFWQASGPRWLEAFITPGTQSLPRPCNTPLERRKAFQQALGL